MNGNGTLDAGDTIATTATTDAGGVYTLSLKPGKYVVCEVQQADWTQSFAGEHDLRVDGHRGTARARRLRGDHHRRQHRPGNDFGNYQQRHEVGHEVQRPERQRRQGRGRARPAGWTINAYADANGNGTLTRARHDRRRGHHRRRRRLHPEPHARQVRRVRGAAGRLDPVGAVEHDLRVQRHRRHARARRLRDDHHQRQTESDNDFGNWTTATKSGLKFYDNDKDGSYEPLPDLQNDTALSGWVIELWKWNGTAYEFVVADTTDGTGYSFSGLAPGTYAVCEIQQTDYVQSFPFAGATLPAGESVFDCTALTPNGGGTFGAFGIGFVATSGANLTNNLFGNYLVPPGCTLTQGYWKTHSIYGPAAHPDDTWYGCRAASDRIPRSSGAVTPGTRCSGPTPRVATPGTSWRTSTWPLS